MSVEKRENYASGSSDAEGVDSGAEEVNAPAATIPKKRGRPPKGANKVVKVPTGRRVGRPAKIPGAPPKVAEENGRKGSRSRPGKPIEQKIDIAATVKGRGRPKNPNKDAAEESAPKKAKPSGNKRGRPRKAVEASDEEVSNEEEEAHTEKRKVGRPNTGAVNSNIQRTGKGQGRPTSAAVKKAAQRAEAVKEGVPQKRRGRPLGISSAPEMVVSEEEDNLEDVEEEEDENEDENHDFHDSVAEIEELDEKEINAGKKVADANRSKLAAA